MADDRLVDLLAVRDALIVERAVLAPFEGPPQRAGGRASVDVDDLLVVVAPSETVTPFHAVWHSADRSTSGPYRIRGELPALPGFDPVARAGAADAAPSS